MKVAWHSVVLLPVLLLPMVVTQGAWVGLLVASVDKRSECVRSFARSCLLGLVFAHGKAKVEAKVILFLFCYSLHFLFACSLTTGIDRVCWVSTDR